MSGVLLAVVVFLACSSKQTNSEISTSLPCLKGEILTYSVQLNMSLWARAQGERFMITAKFDTVCVADGFLDRFDQRGIKHRLTVYDFDAVSVIENGEEMDDKKSSPREKENIRSAINKRFEKPFYYVQLGNGSVAFVLHRADEDTEILNVKKGIASLFQTTLEKGERDLIEVGGGSKHRAHYQVEVNKGQVVVHKRYSSDDVERFARGSNVDPSKVTYDEEDHTVMKDGTPEEISGKLHAVLYEKTNKADQGNKVVNDELEEDESSPPPSSDDSDSESFQATSGLDGELAANQTYRIKLISRRKINVKRSAAMVKVEDTHGLQVGSIEAELSEAEIVHQQRTFSKHQIPEVIEQLEDIITANGEHTGSYFQLVNALELEGQCQYYHCLSQKETPITNIVISYFKAGTPKLRHGLFPLLVASGTVAAQKLMSKVLATPTDYKVDQKIVLTYVAFLHNPSRDVVSAVTKLLDLKRGEGQEEAELALGSLAQNAGKETSDAITTALLKRLDNSIWKKSSSLVVNSLLLALGNTGNVMAAPVLVGLLGGPTLDEEAQAVLASVLNQLAEANKEFVDNLLLERLQKEPANGTLDVALGIMHILAQRQRGKKSEQSQIELAVVAKLTEHSDQKAQHERKRRSFDSSSDWASSHNQYNDIASLSSRQSDESMYPTHLAYLYRKKIGISKLNLRFTAGAFVGAKRNGGSVSLKVYGKAVAIAHVFGNDFEVLNTLVSVVGKDSTITYEVYARLGGHTIIPQRRHSANIPSLSHTAIVKPSFRRSVLTIGPLSCSSRAVNVGKSEYFTVFDLRVNLPLILGLTVRLGLKGRFQLEGSFNFKICPLEDTIATANFKPVGTLIVDGSAYSSIFQVVRGGIQVTARFNYYLKPEGTIRRNGATVSVCFSVKHGNDASTASLAPYYQKRTFTLKRWRPVFGWSSRKTISWLSFDWKIGGARESTLYEDCPWRKSLG